MLIHYEDPLADLDRTDSFAELARRIEDGAVLVPPRLLDGQDRREHVRRTLREDHRHRIRNAPEGARTKFDKLAGSRFSFFRGTALLFYRDMPGLDAHLPVVLCVGDVHPENFGVMPNDAGAPIFGVNDFDEACFAPFSWDLRRGSVGFWLALRELGQKKKHRTRIIRTFLNGYFEGLEQFARDDRETDHQWRIDNSPPLIHDLLESAVEKRREFLGDMVDLETGCFRATDEIVPISGRVAEFGEIVDRYVKENDLGENLRAGHFHVKDVATKKKSGTASLGLDRYFVLVEGPGDGVGDDLVLEFKKARVSALTGLAPQPPDGAVDGKADRIVLAHRIQLVGGDPYYGIATIDDDSYMVRERSPVKDDMDLDDLDRDQLEAYADICGQTLAQAHARSDEDTGILEGDAEAAILTSVQREVFIDDVLAWTRETAHRLKRDHAYFKQDLELGAFAMSKLGAET